MAICGLKKRKNAEKCRRCGNTNSNSLLQSMPFPQCASLPLQSSSHIAIQFCNPRIFRNAAKKFSPKTNRYDIFCHPPPAMFIGIAFAMIIMAKTIFHFMNFIINNLNNSNLYQNNRKVKKNACIKKNRVYGIFKVLSKKVCIWIVYN